MVMDYNDVYSAALKSLREDIDKKLNVFNLLPKKFTMKDAQDIYQYQFSKENFRIKCFRTSRKEIYRCGK
jgi:hypothetical protein